VRDDIFRARPDRP